MFAKIFQTIFDSSIADDWKTRIVFQDMLVLADKDGVVDMTLEAIARRTNIPLEIVREAIPKLEAEDKSSRTADHDGRRILRLDTHRNWGWRIVNFVKYRESATKEMLRMAEADRKRAYRSKFIGRNHHTSSPTPPTQVQKQKQRETCPVTSPGHVRDSDAVTAPIALNEKISHEKTLTRLSNELRGLGSLRDHDKGSLKYNRVKALTERQAELRKILGVIV